MTHHAIARSCVICITLLGAGTASVARASSILAGSDYFTTTSASFDFTGLSGGAVGVVPLTGRFGPGIADTAVIRLENANPGMPGSDTIDIRMQMLALMSLTSVNIGGSLFDVFVSLDPDPAAPSVGTMTIFHNPSDTPGFDGTFNSNLTVNFLAAFVPVGGTNPSMVFKSSLSLTQSGASWGHEPAGVIVPGLVGDLFANCHAVPNGPPCSPMDFFPGPVDEVHPGVGRHQARPADVLCDSHDPACTLVPEPGTSVLLLSGLAAMLAKRWRQKAARR